MHDGFSVRQTLHDAKALQKHSSSIPGVDIQLAFVCFSGVSIPRGLTWLTGVVVCPRLLLFMDRYAFLHDGCISPTTWGAVYAGDTELGQWTSLLVRVVYYIF